MQTGGLIIVEAGGEKVLFTYKQKSPGDHVENEVILNTLGIAAAEPVADGDKVETQTGEEEPKGDSEKAEDKEKLKPAADGEGEKAEATGEKTEATGEKAEATGEKAEATGEKVEATGEKAEASGKQAVPQEEECEESEEC